MKTLSLSPSTRMSKGITAVLAILLSCMQILSAQNAGESNTDKEPCKLKIIKIVNGDTLIEDRIVDGEPGQMMMFTDDGQVHDLSKLPEGSKHMIIEIDEENLGEGESGQFKKIIIKSADGKDGEMKFEIMGAGEGEGHVIIMNGEKLDIVPGGEGHKVIELTNEIVIDGGEGEMGKMHIIKVIDGDTVMNEMKEGHPNQMIWHDDEGNTHHPDGAKMMFIKEECGGGNEGENVEIQVTVDEDGNKKVIMIRKIAHMEIDDLTEEEAEKFAPAPNAELDLRKMEYFPNPNEGRFTLRFKLRDKQSPAEIRIFSIAGEEVYREEFSGSARYEKEIDLRDAPAGIYLLSITQNGKKAVKKLILQ